MLTIAIILGTRPEIIKTWPIVFHADKDPQIDCKLIHTGQHYDYEMAQVFFEDLKLREPDVFLKTQGDTHAIQTANMLMSIEGYLLKENIDVVGVLGDTNSAMAGALAAQKIGIPTAHFEAGCRSFDFNMPEELNRLIIDAIASMYFAPSLQAEINLLWEGKPKNRIFVCGNTQKDVLNFASDVTKSSSLPQDIKSPYGVVTVHRAENTDNLDRLQAIMVGLRSSSLPLVFPVHPRTRKQLKNLDDGKNNNFGSKIKLIDPIGYLSFIQLLSQAKFVLTDSGGVQEEAAMLNIPCITLRDTTEWPETILSKKNILVGANVDLISAVLNKLTVDSHFYQEMSRPAKLFEGNAGKKIISVLKKLAEEDNLGIAPINMMESGYPLPFLATNMSEFPAARTSFSTSLIFQKDGTISPNNSSGLYHLLRVYSLSNFNPQARLEP